MTKHVRTTIRYDGPALSGHEIDVQDLAPALLALADIIQIANRKFNGDRADVKVMVSADVEQQCFMIDLSLVMSFLDQAKTFFESDRVKTAREIAEWIGLIGTPVAVTGGGIFAVLKLLRNKKDGDAPFQITQGDGNVTITGNGNTFVFPTETYLLAQERSVIEKVKIVTRPLERDGYDSLSFMQGDETIVEISEAEASEISEVVADDFLPLPAEVVANIRGVVRIKSPQYESTAKWSLLYQGRAIDAEMTGSAAEWVVSFQSNKVAAPPNTVLDVSMTETVRINDEGQAVAKPVYAVHEIHAVTPPPTQISLI